MVRHDVTAAARGLIDLMLGVGGELVTVLLGDARDGAAVGAPRWASMSAAIIWVPSWSPTTPDTTVTPCSSGWSDAWRP